MLFIIRYVARLRFLEKRWNASKVRFDHPVVPSTELCDLVIERLSTFRPSPSSSLCPPVFPNLSTPKLASFSPVSRHGRHDTGSINREASCLDRFGERFRAVEHRNGWNIQESGSNREGSRSYSLRPRRLADFTSIHAPIVRIGRLSDQESSLWK